MIYAVGLSVTENVSVFVFVNEWFYINYLCHVNIDGYFGLTDLLSNYWL